MRTELSLAGVAAMASKSLTRFVSPTFDSKRQAYIISLIIHLFHPNFQTFSNVHQLRQFAKHSCPSDKSLAPQTFRHLNIYMPNLFLKEELYRIPVALTNSWPHTPASWLNFAPLFMMSSGASFASMEDRDKLEFCNAQLRFHMNSARWYGRWRNPLVNDDGKNLGLPVLPVPPIAVPELSLVTSGTFMARTLYGAFVCCWDCVHILLTVMFTLVCSMMIFLVVTEDAPIFVGWRTLDIPYWDVDKIQLSTRTVHSAVGYLPFPVSNAAPSFFRLTVIYTRYVRGIIVFKRKHSQRAPYVDFLDLFGRFDSLKFEKWMRSVALDAMNTPYGSVWNLWHLTLS